MDLLLSSLVAVSVCQCQTEGRTVLETGIIKIPEKKTKPTQQNTTKTHKKLKYKCPKHFSAIYMLYSIFDVNKIVGHTSVQLLWSAMMERIAQIPKY